jgi:hypothetical protein
MRRNKTYVSVAGTRVRARDEQEEEAKLRTQALGLSEEILRADLFVRVPLQQVTQNPGSFDLLLYNYFGATGFDPVEPEVEHQREGQFVKYGSLNGIEVGTIAVGDSVYLSARPLNEPTDPRAEKAMIWLERVMAVAKQAANHLFERNALREDLPAMMVHRYAESCLHIQECSWRAALAQQSQMLGVSYQTLDRTEFQEWMQRIAKKESAYDISNLEWAAGEKLIKSGVEEVALTFDGENYHFADADALGTPSQSEYLTKLWQQKHQGFVLVGAHELVDAKQRLPHWLTEDEKEAVLEQANRCLVPMFYGARFAPELSGLAQRFDQEDPDEVYEIFFREVNDGKIRFQLEQETGRILIDQEDAHRKLSALFEARRIDRQEPSFQAQEKKGRGISVQ